MRVEKYNGYVVVEVADCSAADSERAIAVATADRADRDLLALRLQTRLIAALLRDDVPTFNEIIEMTVQSLPTYTAGLVLEALAEAKR